MLPLPVALTALALVAGPEAPSIPFEKYQLPNGLEVILHVDKTQPVVGVNLWYHVGALHEVPGRTGFAHLFEHMMFSGSRHVAAPYQLLEQIGASDINGTTSFDRTNYFETVPANHLETALWIESDRMGYLLDALNAGKLATQIDVVKNERRQSTETAPYGLAQEKFWQALFPAPHPYYGMVIGSLKDLGAATLDEVKGFFRAYYAPSNATLALSGDFDPAKARELVTKYFGSLPKVAPPAAPKVAAVQLEKPVALQHDEKVSPLPAVMVGWLTPAFFQEGDAAADLLGGVLSAGESSRLQRRLVREKQLAQSVSAGQESLGAQSVFRIQAVGRPGVDPAVLLKEIDTVLSEVESGLTEAEVSRVKNRVETDLMLRLQGVGGFGGKGDRLQTYNHYLKDPGYLARDLERYRRLTAADLMAFTQRYLARHRSVVLSARPAPAASKAPPAPSSPLAAAPRARPQESAR